MATSDTGCTGFDTYPFMPASMHRSLSPLIACAVIAIIGKSAHSRFARIFLVVSKPSITGICTSINTRSNRLLAATDFSNRSSATNPFEATSIS